MDATLPLPAALPGRAALALPGLVKPLAGLVLLGLAGACARPEIAVFMAVLPTGLFLVAGVMSAPLLLVLHQALGLAASPQRMAAALAQGARAAGGLAGGLAPAVLFFSLTSMRGSQALVVALLWAGWAGLRAARRHLTLAETEAGGGRPFASAALAEAWCAVAMLLGLRLGWLAFHLVHRAA